MIKKTILFILFLVFCSSDIFSQEQKRISVSVENTSIYELFNIIEKQTGNRIYCQMKDIDPLLVTISCIDETPVAVLSKALRETTLKVSSYNDMIFILPEQRLITSLPEGYFIKEEEEAVNVEYELSAFSLTDSRQSQKLASENRVYEIGDASLKKKGRVTLKGSISNHRNGEPMVGLSVSLKDPITYTSTDANGNYTIQLPVGRQELYIGGVNVKDTKLQLLVYSDGKLDVDLEEEIVLLDEAVVSTERIANVRSTTMGMERIRMQNIKNVPVAFGEVDVIKAVLLLPGVKSVGEVSSGFNVRGGATDQNLILFNDGTIYNPSHLFGMFSAFNPDIVKDMELYKSSIPAKYGGRISSVLDITSKEGDKKEYHGSASIGLLTSRLTLEGPIIKDKLSFMVGGRTTYSDWILNLLDEKSGYKDGSASFYDFNAILSYKINERSNLQLSGYYSHDRFRFTKEQKYRYGNINASLKWRYIFNDRLIGTLTAGYDQYGYKTISEESPLTSYSLAFNIKQGFGKLSLLWNLGDHVFDFGVNSIYYDLEPGEYLPNGSESLVQGDIMQKEKALESAIYLGYVWNITNRLSLDVGLRYSIYNVLGPRTYNLYSPDNLPSLETVTDVVTKDGGIFKTYHGPEVRASARYAFTDDFSIKGGFSTMRQNIHKLSNTTIMSPTDTWKLSDANIKPQTGKQLALGLYKNFAGHTIETSVEGYYKTMEDYLDYRGGAKLLMNHHIETDVLTTEGRAYGIELALKKMQGKLTGWVSYTYSRTKLRQSDIREAEPVNGGDWYPAAFDKPHDLKFIGNYKLTHRFSFSMNCEYSTGRSITLPISKYYYAGGQYVFYSERNKYRIPDFFRMDISFNIEPSHNLTLLTHSTISVGVYNVTGRKNAYSVYYISEDTGLQGYQLSIFGAPIPYVSYNIKF